MSNLKQIIEDSFTQYSGAVLQSRALVDVRDCIKPSARQIFYSMVLNKLTSKNKYRKTANAVGLAMAEFYIHGDSSCEGIIMRAGQPFAMRYPLVDVKGNRGSLIKSGNWAAPRYTESRLGKLSDCLFTDINKNTIEEWRDNYDNSKQYPAVLPTKGFYNIVNGCQGIGVGAASSIPQFNLCEVNNALIKLLQKPDCNFEEICCLPDFATGGILLNADEVKESLKNGQGSACKLRAVVDFDSKERCFIVTEIPYSVYSNTICGELEAILNSEDNPGIERFGDFTGENPLIKIYLNKRANADRVLKYLYKNTSLQSYYGINMTMLENGRFPRVYNWKEALLAHLDHERIVYTRGFQFDLAKIEARLHIIEGLLCAIADIDEVVKTIKASTSTAAASVALQKLLTIDEVQAKAILDIKLARLAHLEIDKLKNEQAELIVDRDRISAIINSPELLNREIEKGLQEVANKFGDERRTQILNVEHENDEPTEVKSLLISATNKNNFYLSEVSSLYTQKRGGVGTKFKLDKGEFVTKTCSADNIDTIMLFTDKGLFYHAPISSIPIEEKVAIETVVQLKPGEKVSTFIPCNKATKENQNTNILFITKKGMLKKSSLTEYNLKRTGGIKALELDEGDSICAVMVSNDERVGILTAGGQFMQCETKDVRPIGRVCRGVKAIKLNDGDSVVAARAMPSAVKEIVSVSTSGAIKRSNATEFTVTGRNTKGGKMQKLKDDSDSLIDFLPLVGETEIVVTSSRAQLKVSLVEIPLLSKNTLGIRSIKLGEKDTVVALSKF